MTTQSNTPDPGGNIGCIAVTGGTGSFGAAFTKFLLCLPRPPRIRIYSRDEHKQEVLARELNDDRVTFILGDIRDGDRLRRALDGCDALVHAAALKVVGQGERHVAEFVDVNVTGTQRVMDAAIDARVASSILISSDKAVMPINLYGTTKAVAERLFIYANRIAVSRGLTFSAARGGNVWGSRGSVVEAWRTCRSSGRPLDVYGPDTTRFHLPMSDWTAFVWRALSAQHGGEVFIPKVRAWRLGDLAEAFGVDWVNNGRRNGDKDHEMLIAPHEVQRTTSIDWAYVVEPPSDLRSVWNYVPYCIGAPSLCDSYRSDTTDRLTVDELRRLIDEG